MKVSTVISTYNGSQFILEQLESIRTQTRPVDEVLIYDDGSSDDTVSKITAYLAKHNLTTWKIKQNKQNVGWRQNFMNLLCYILSFTLMSSHICIFITCICSSSFIFPHLNLHKIGRAHV